MPVVLRPARYASEARERIRPGAPLSGNRRLCTVDQGMLSAGAREPDNRSWQVCRALPVRHGACLCQRPLRATYIDGTRVWNVPHDQG